MMRRTMNQRMVIGCWRGGSVLMVLLVACSHGSVRPLHVVSMLPQGQAVEPTTPVRVTFDQPVAPATLLPAAFAVRDQAGPIAGGYSYNAELLQWTFTPTEPLPLGASLTVTLDRSLTTVQGDPFLGSSWSFSVRQGVPSAMQLVRTAAAVTSGLHLVMHEGSGLLAAGNEAWRIQQGVPGPLETLPVSAAQSLSLDDAGGVALLGTATAGSPPQLAVVLRSPAGTWGQIASPINHALGYTPMAVRLFGDGLGNLVLHGQYTDPPSNWIEHRIAGTTKGAVMQWTDLHVRIAQNYQTTAATLGAGGSLGVVRNDGEFVLAERWASVMGSSANFSLGYGLGLRVETAAVSADGTLRAIWHGVGGAFQSLVPPTGQPSAATMIPVGVSLDTQWYTAASGALLGTNVNRAVRSDATGALWQEATLPSEPLAAGISARGEAVFVTFAGGDAWSLIRWRQGEVPDAPLLIATLQSRFNAPRSAALALEPSGRVTVALVPDVPGDLHLVTIE